MRLRLSLKSTATAALLYLVLTVALTWPVAAHMATRVPGDLGDPLLNMWILGWDMSHLERFVSGDVTALRGVWSANIFYPTPLTLAYSEHLFPLALQALPVYLISHSLPLCYNLLFLSTFFLSALGAYWLARALTRNAPAALLCGLFYGFALYRLVHIGHLQVLSSQWMPFCLLGLWRFAETRRPWPLAGAGLALLVQGLSCGYYLFYFSPFAIAFAVWALWRHQRLRDRAAWGSLATTAVLAVAVALPFLLPYAEVRATGVITRTAGELAMYSADVTACVRADRAARLWGGPHRAASAPSETALFPGVLPVLLAALGLVTALRSLRKGPAVTRWRQALAHPCVAFVLAALAATLLAFGPTIRFAGHALAPGPYALVARTLPGFDSLRVPARFAMLVALFVAIAAAEGCRLAAGRYRGLLLLASAGLFLVECTAAPLSLSRVIRDRGLRRMPPLELPSPAIYADVARLPHVAVLIELPIGAPAHDVRAVFYSTTHWRRLVNGYSGAQPPGYFALTSALKEALAAPEAAWAALRASGATHVLVHEASWRPPKGHALSAWLAGHGARQVSRVDRDALFALPGGAPSGPGN